MQPREDALKALQNFELETDFLDILGSCQVNWLNVNGFYSLLPL